MPTTVFTATNYLALIGYSQNSTTASWTGELRFSSAPAVVDQNDYGNIDSTGSPDYFDVSTTPYSGFTVEGLMMIPR